ncbi:hypothetical protein HY58_12650 [Flavihumibacter sp. ZG627]|nr:hypothetical protein HY58_12650 [Flavihumibacter sp. ZG627]
MRGRYENWRRRFFLQVEIGWNECVQIFLYAEKKVRNKTLAKMSIENLVNQINTYCKLSEADVEIIESTFSHNTFKSKEFVLRQGQISNQIHFVETGLVRIFHFFNKKIYQALYLKQD